jgi:hypothetical protein
LAVVFSPVVAFVVRRLQHIQAKSLSRSAKPGRRMILTTLAPTSSPNRQTTFYLLSWALPSLERRSTNSSGTSKNLIVARLEDTDHIIRVVKTLKRKRLLEPNGGFDGQKPCYDHRFGRDFVARIAYIRASRRSDECSIEVQQCDPYREPGSRSASWACANSQFWHYGILFFFGDTLRATALR